MTTSSMILSDCKLVLINLKFLEEKNEWTVENSSVAGIIFFVFQRTQTKNYFTHMNKVKQMYAASPLFVVENIYDSFIIWMLDNFVTKA